MNPREACLPPWHGSAVAFVPAGTWGAGRKPANLKDGRTDEQQAVLSRYTQRRQAAQAAGEVSRLCGELVFGYNAHPAWQDAEHRNCFLASELEDYEITMPGITSIAVDVLGQNGSHPDKAGPCAGCAGSGEFLRLQSKLTMCLSGSRLAKDRAADTVSKVMIPAALDYPA